MFEHMSTFQWQQMWGNGLPHMINNLKVFHVCNYCFTKDPIVIDDHPACSCPRKPQGYVHRGGKGGGRGRKWLGQDRGTVTSGNRILSNHSKLVKKNSNLCKDIQIHSEIVTNSNYISSTIHPVKVLRPNQSQENENILLKDSSVAETPPPIVT